MGDKEFKNIVKNRLFATCVSITLFLVGFYVKSFASTTDLKRIEETHKTDIIEVKNHHSLDMQAIKSEFKLIKSGLCIIDKRTCKLSN